MNTNFEFVEDEKELVQSAIEFFGKPQFWKATIGNAPLLHESFRVVSIKNVIMKIVRDS